MDIILKYGQYIILSTWNIETYYAIFKTRKSYSAIFLPHLVVFFSESWMDFEIQYNCFQLRLFGHPGTEQQFERSV